MSALGLHTSFRLFWTFHHFLFQVQPHRASLLCTIPQFYPLTRHLFFLHASGRQSKETLVLKLKEQKKWKHSERLEIWHRFKNAECTQEENYTFFQFLHKQMCLQLHCVHNASTDMYWWFKKNPTCLASRPPHMKNAQMEHKGRGKTRGRRGGWSEGWAGLTYALSSTSCYIMVQTNKQLPRSLFNERWGRIEKISSKERRSRRPAPWKDEEKNKKTSWQGCVPL